MKERKKALCIVVAALIIGISCGSARGAEQNEQDMRKAVQEMRQNIVWTTEGLRQLGRSRDHRLALTKTEARKLLPIYQELITKKLIRLEMGKRDGRFGRNGGSEEGPGIRGQGASQGNFRRGGKMPKEMTELVAFANQKMRQIDGILSKSQVSMIDNLDFDGSKYGFFNRHELSGNTGNRRMGSSSGLRGGFGSGSGKMNEMRKKFAEKRKNLVDLNQEVLKILKKLQ